MGSRIRHPIEDYLSCLQDIYCDLGQELVKWGPLVNIFEVVVHLAEYLVLPPFTS